MNQPAHPIPRSAIAAAGALLVLGVAGIGLGFAFLLVPSVIANGGAALSPEEVDMSRRLAAIVWLPSGIGLLHVLAAFAVLSPDRRWQHVVLVLAGVGMIMGILVAPNVGGAWLVVGNVMTAHLVALGSSLVRHRAAHRPANRTARPPAWYRTAPA